jgi:hypothetical protein
MDEEPEICSKIISSSKLSSLPHCLPSIGGQDDHRLVQVHILHVHVEQARVAVEAADDGHLEEHLP